jgi:hypothetical protein
LGSGNLDLQASNVRLILTSVKKKAGGREGANEISHIVCMRGLYARRILGTGRRLFALSLARHRPGVGMVVSGVLLTRSPATRAGW